MLLIEELDILKPKEQDIVEYVRPPGRAPEVFVKQIGNTGLIKL